ncbi:MAG: ATP-binding cassette domain-containing protein, partial [Myxococcota bacterium]|nr:ATP-binding cassette domain-containing protein [Myxococcota bacterium]
MHPEESRPQHSTPVNASGDLARSFVHLLVGVLSDADDPQRVREPLRRALGARFDLEAQEVDTILSEALAPERRLRVTEVESRAYAALFGTPAAELLREELAREPSLHSFQAQTGPSEALLLLDAMFTISAVDGVIAQDRVARLQTAAEALEVDPQLVAFLFRKHDVRHANGDFFFSLDQPNYILGRGPEATVRLPDPQVALEHVALVRRGRQWEVIDLGSGRPTLLNGEPVRRAPLNPGDDLRVGPYALSLDQKGRSLVAFGMNAFSSLSIRNIERKIGDVHLLNDVSFTVFSGEVIAIVGPSGAGKTTLLNAITGIAPADTGEVLFEGRNFHRLLAVDSTYVGMVPQDDVVHAELEVGEALHYAARLRYPKDIGDDILSGEVDRVLESLGIDHVKSSRIGDEVRRGVSGGQRKRVNLGQELLTRTTRVMFLDEPTSGLDPQTAIEIVALTRQLADEGRIIFLVTHDVSSDLMAMIDHLLVLAPGGRLAWFGPPKRGCEHFGVDSVGEIFGVLAQESPQEWSSRYRYSEWWNTFVGMREHLLGLVETQQSNTANQVKKRHSRLQQWLTLCKRTTVVKLRDAAGTAVLLAQAPVLGLAMVLAFPKPDVACMFMLALSSLWFGASDSVRELIAERSIWRRESRIGLGLFPYLASKVFVLGVLVTIQCSVLVAFNYVALDMAAYGFSFFELAGACTLTGLVGVTLGLLMSSVFPTSEAAIASLPLLLIPQIAFGGLIVTVKKMGVTAKLISYAMITRYAFELSIKTGEELSIPGARGSDTYQAHIKGPLWDLGFRTSGAEDMGLSMP